MSGLEIAGGKFESFRYVVNFVGRKVAGIWESVSDADHAKTQTENDDSQKEYKRLVLCKARHGLCTFLNQ